MKNVLIDIIQMTRFELTTSLPLNQKWKSLRQSVITYCPKPSKSSLHMRGKQSQIKQSTRIAALTMIVHILICISSMSEGTIQTKRLIKCIMAYVENYKMETNENISCGLFGLWTGRVALLRIIIHQTGACRV